MNMLTDADIQAILAILDDSPYDELDLSTERFHLQLQRSAQGEGWTQTRKALGVAQSTVSQVDEQTPSAGQEEPLPLETGLIDVRAPMAGTFYRSPKPGAPPFVEAGSQVEEDSIIAIIEVMKLMSSVPCRQRGEIREILVDDATPVQKGQLLMRIRPAP